MCEYMISNILTKKNFVSSQLFTQDGGLFGKMFFDLLYSVSPGLQCLKVAHYCKVRHIGQIKGEAPTHLPENQYN